MSQNQLLQDAITKEVCQADQGLFLADMDGHLRQLVLHDYPQLKDDDFLTDKSLLPYRMAWLNQTIERAQVKNDHIKETVYDVTKKSNYKPMDIQEVLDQKVTFGQRVADDVARFGGSWTFIISFILFMGLWMAVNVFHSFGIQFDAYPFILLNLALSTLAAIQAPLIMMSQNRASDYDRLQAKNDYLVNQKSEEGVRLLHTKIDHLVQQDQSDLLEVQKLQTEMLAAMTQQLALLEKQNANLAEKLNQLNQSQDT